MSNWNPKPRRDKDPNPLFPVEEVPMVQKALSPIERQRANDGSPMTAVRPSALKAPDPQLTLKKGSHAGNIKEGRHDPVKSDPPITKVTPDDVVKAFLFGE